MAGILCIMWKYKLQRCNVYNQNEIRRTVTLSDFAIKDGIENMDIGNCSVCGKLYIKVVATRMCSNCLEKEEEAVQLVSEYVKVHQRCTVEEVHEVTGIEQAVIYRMIERGCLQECENLEYPCQQCKKVINKGRLCKTCLGSFLKQVKEIQSEQDKMKEVEVGYQSSRMYTNSY